MRIRVLDEAHARVAGAAGAAGCMRAFEAVCPSESGAEVGAHSPDSRVGFN